MAKASSRTGLILPTTVRWLTRSPTWFAISVGRFSIKTRWRLNLGRPCECALSGLDSLTDERSTTRPLPTSLPSLSMKLLDRTFRYFYSTEVMTSVCQLREDFGDFPPKPLGGNGLPGHFTTVRVRGIGEHIHFAVMMKRLVEGAAGGDSLSPTIRNHMADVLTLKFFRGPIGIRKKVLMWIGLGTIFVASALNLIRMAPKGMNSLGFFAPIRREESRKAHVGSHAGCRETAIHSARLRWAGSSFRSSYCRWSLHPQRLKHRIDRVRIKTGLKLGKQLARYGGNIGNAGHG